MISNNYKKLLPQNQINEIKQKIRNKKYSYNEIYTTYFSKDFSDFKFLENFYLPVIQGTLQDYGLIGRCKCEANFWIQMYNSETKGHDVHDHFGGSQIISWVHFVSAPEEKCFYFVDSFGNKNYPENQSSGDFIFFPPWRSHGVDAVKSKNFDRIIIAGNVHLTEYLSTGEFLKMENTEKMLIWHKIKT
jgi:hypothetical protein